ncbi:MAG: cupin domain-containing protein [Bacteroidales bacterium]|nr:cupin domain-containing protein [Bacteroidales bacterium]
MLTAQDVIRLLQLQPHPIEGGFFRETQRTPETIPASALPSHPGDRSAGTTIYYLLTADCVSEMHRLPGEEVFHFYLGDPLEQLQLLPDGTGKTITLGPDLLAGQVPQLVVPAGVWQGSQRLPGPHGFSLIGATMAPGFDYADYITGQRAELTSRWPQFQERIHKLTPKG